MFWSDVEALVSLRDRARDGEGDGTRGEARSGEIVGMFAAGITVIVEVALLLAGFGSALVAAAVTVAVFVTGPGDEGSVTVSVKVAEAPLVERTGVAGDGRRTAARAARRGRLERRTRRKDVGDGDGRGGVGTAV